MSKKIAGPIQFTDATHNTYSVVKHEGESKQSISDTIAEEVPVAFEYNGISHTVMMATPQDLEDFAVGFSLSEGIVSDVSQVYGVEVSHEPLGVTLKIEMASACFNQLKEKRRSMTGRTGCGLCGSDSLEQALRLPEALPVFSPLKVRASSIARGLQSLQEMQSLQQVTGATHACALVGEQGKAQLCREDVGRHNALDKLVGAMQRQPNEHANGFIVTSSRASYEMVQKTVAAGIGMLVAVSAPTGLAIRMAKQYGVTLIGFARNGRFVVYIDDRQQLVN